MGEGLHNVKAISMMKYVDLETNFQIGPAISPYMQVTKNKQ